MLSANCAFTEGLALFKLRYVTESTPELEPSANVATSYDVISAAAVLETNLSGIHSFAVVVVAVVVVVVVVACHHHHRHIPSTVCTTPQAGRALFKNASRARVRTRHIAHTKHTQ